MEKSFWVDKKKYFFLALVIVLIFALLIFGIMKFFQKKPFILKDFFPSEEKEFYLVESSPENFQTSFPIVGRPMLVFSQKLAINEKEISQYVSIFPSAEGRWRIEPNKQVIFFASDREEQNGLSKALKHNTVYTIRVKKGLPSSSGQVLSKDIEIKFLTKKNPLFNYVVNHKLIRTIPKKPFSISLFAFSDNISFLPDGYTVSIYKAKKEQLLKFFIYNDYHRWMKSLFYEFTPTEGPILSYDNLNVKKNEYEVLIEIPGIEEEGLYYLRIGNKHGFDDLLVANTNYVLQVIEDERQLLAQVVEGKTGRPLFDKPLFFYTLRTKPQLLAQGKTDDKGFFSLTIQPEKQPEIVILDDGKELVVSETKQRYFPSKIYRVFATSDRPIYKPGDTLHYKAVIRQVDKEGLILPKEQFYLRLLMSTYQLSDTDYIKVDADEFGTIAYDFSIPKNTTQLYADIQLAVKIKDKYELIDTYTVDIQPYRKPDLELIAETVDKEYISKDTARFNIIAKTLYGSPFGRIPFSYRVLVNDYTEIKNRQDESLFPSSFYGFGKELTSGNGIFDEKGLANLSFSTDLSGFEESQIMTIEITPNLGISPSIAKNTKLIHRGEFALFFNNIKKDTLSGISGEIEALDHQLKRQPVAEKEVEVFLERIIDSNQKELIEEITIKTDNNGKGSFHFNQKIEGSYQLKIQAKDSRQNIITAKYQFYLKAVSASRTKQIPSYSFKLSFPTKDYQQGELVNIQFKTDIPQGQVFAVAHANKTIIDILGPVNLNETIDYKIPSINTSTITIDAFSVYDNEIYRDQIPIYLNRDSYQIEIKAEFRQKNPKPGETVQLDITTFDKDGRPISTDISLTLVDEAVLQINPFTGKIFDYYYPKESNSYLLTHNSNEGIYNNRPPGGGGGDGEVKPRKNFNDTAYWNPRIRTDSSGKTSVTIKLPHNITNYAGRLYANTKDSKFGQKEISLIVKQEMVIMPVLANFYFQSDKPVIKAIIHNSSAKSIKGMLMLEVIDLKIKESREVFIDSNDFQEVKFSVELPKNIKVLKTLFTLKSDSGDVLDMIEQSTPIISRGRITYHWATFENNVNLEVRPSFNEMDINSLNFYIFSYPVIKLFQNRNDDYSFADFLSQESGKRLFRSAQIIRLINQLKINPAAIGYAHLMNELRHQVEIILDQVRADNQYSWFIKYSEEGLKQEETKLLSALGLQIILEEKLIDDAPNLENIINSVKPKTNDSLTEFLYGWLTKKPLPKNVPSHLRLALEVLQNKPNALKELLNQKILTASDRYFWPLDDRYDYLNYILPALAVIEKGSSQDADKALKGFLFSRARFFDEMDSIIAVAHAGRRKIKIDKPDFSIKLNGQNIYQSPNFWQGGYFYHPLFLEFNQLIFDKTKIEIENRSRLPLYIIITQSNYQIDNNKGITDLSKSLPIRITKEFKRSYKSLNDVTAPISTGNTLITVIKNPQSYEKLINTQTDCYTSSLIDFISPRFLFLDQTSGNSPQFYEMMKQMFGDEKNFTMPTDFSHQMVKYKLSKMIPYMVYSSFVLTEGEYYQPKTSIIFPYLGVIVEER